MKSENQIKQLAKDIRIKPDADVDERILAFAEAKLTKSIKNRDVAALRRHLIRKKIMKSPITKLAAAAAIIITCAIGLSFWRTTGSGIALADVLASVEQVKTFSSKCTMKITIEDPKNPYNYEGRCTGLTSQEYGSKITESYKESDPNVFPWEKIDFLECCT